MTVAELVIWTISAEQITVLELRDNAYAAKSVSRYFPELDMAAFFEFIRIARADQHEGVKAFDSWLRGEGAKK